MAMASKGSDTAPQGQVPAQGTGMKGIAAVVVAGFVIAAGLAAMVMLSPPPSPPSPPSPCERSESVPLQFSSVTKGGAPPFNNSASWEVVCLRKSLAALSFRIYMMRDYDMLTPDHQDLRFNLIVPFGPSVRLKVTDVDWNGRLTHGDRFMVYGMDDHYNWRLGVLSTDEHQIMMGEASWDTMSSPPTVFFSQPTYGGAPLRNVTMNWTVVDAPQRTYVFSNYRANIKKDGTSLTLTAVTLHANTVISFGSYAELIVSDVTGEGNLTAGDRFLVYGMDEGHSWNFSLIWSPTSVELRSIQWTTNSPEPIITFSAITRDGTPPANHSVEWTVVDASTPIYNLCSYLVSIEMDGTSLGPFPFNLTSGVKLEFGASVRFIFRDIGTDGRLGAGDSFLVYGMGKPHNWRFNLFWTGNIYEPQYLDWTTP